VPDTQEDFKNESQRILAAIRAALVAVKRGESEGAERCTHGIAEVKGA
jgi:hypothetical protein